MHNFNIKTRVESFGLPHTLHHQDKERVIIYISKQLINEDTVKISIKKYNYMNKNRYWTYLVNFTSNVR